MGCHYAQRGIKAMSSRNNGRVPFVMLKEQWRMAPSICALVSELSYNDELRDAAGVSSRGLCLGGNRSS